MATSEPAYGALFSNSQLSAWRRCRRKWWLEWYRGLRPRTSRATGVLAVGDRCHRALRAHYDPTDQRYLLDALEDEIAADLAQLTGADGPSDVDLSEFNREANLERVLLRGYLDWLAETGADAELEVVSAETYMIMHLPGRGSLIGQLDVRVRHRVSGELLFLDHKVVGQWPPVQLLPQDQQMLHYGLLSRAQFHSVAGVLYNMIRRVKGTTRRASPPFYRREAIYHNGVQLNSHLEQVESQIDDIRLAEEYLAAWPDDAAHQMYPSVQRSCTWDCLFLAVCPMFDDGSRAEDALAELYVAGDPYDYYRTRGEVTNE
jgi:PD-(D/E)XK nuclease superfamily